MQEPSAALSPAARARQLHQRHPVCDLHCDSILSERDLILRSETGHLDLPRMTEAGVKAQVFAIWSDPKKLKPGEYADYIANGISRLRNIGERAPDRFAIVRSAAELKSTVAAGRIAAIIGVEGGHALEGRLDRLQSWWEAGVRLLTITWCNSNELADGGWDEYQPHAGLSRLGRDAIKEMNRLGMIVDVSHCSEKSFWQILDTSTAPVVASHSGVRALCDHPRNLTDKQIKGLAQHGGLLGMVFLPAFLVSEPAAATIEHVINAIDHVVQLVGPEYVGFGSDWDGFGAGPAGLEDVSKLPAVTAGLLERGYPEEGLQLILGQNFLRVWSAVEQAAE